MKDLNLNHCNSRLIGIYQFASYLSSKMKRAAQEVIESINPLKSKQRYDDQWKDFLQFFNFEENQKPNEEHLILYFNRLRNEKKFASSSLWAKYSMINYKMQTIHGIKLQLPEADYFNEIL